LRFEAVEEILKKMEDTFYRKQVFNAVMKTMETNPSGQAVLGSHAAVIDACKSLLE